MKEGSLVMEKVVRRGRGPDLGHQYSYYTPAQIEHEYGSKVRILSDPYIRTLLARFCDERSKLPLITTLLKEIYRGLLAIVIGAEFPPCPVSRTTRMGAQLVSTEIRAERVKAVTVAIARAGVLSSQVCFEQLLHFFEPENIRQDYLHMSRVVDDNNRVIGASIRSAKIGGDVDSAIVIIPDPMGATGGSMDKALRHYRDEVEGLPHKIVLVHLIITPEYVKRITTEHPDVIIYAARLDRGLSPAEVLGKVPGVMKDRERGLTDEGYIYPGAGGIGEILNQSFV